MLTNNIKKKYKIGIAALLLLLLVGGGIVWWLFTLKYDDTAYVKPQFTLNAMELLGEFRQDMVAANKKYSEKIIVVTGRVSALEPANTTMNVKMIDTTTQAYIIFAFQQQHVHEARQMKVGETVSIKGSCSGGAFSNILETAYITFKRCAVDHSQSTKK